VSFHCWFQLFHFFSGTLLTQDSSSSSGDLLPTVEVYFCD
jgi:hypothetical protein